MLPALQTYLRKETDAAPLAFFRIVFGLLMFVSIARFYLKGWIEAFYIQPQFFFSYYGFEWVKPIGEFTYLIFFIAAISALMMALGYKYRLAALSFFLSFTWIELMDKTTYLNHYYFISLVAFLMILLPAHSFFSVDAFRNPKLAARKIPAWCIDSIKLMLLIVYFFAGIAKLNPDWLFHALPLKIWLPAKENLFLIGPLLATKWAPYLFSWSGALFDLSIGFLLWNKKTRPFAFAAVVFFHLMTSFLFPIGMFPFIMIGCTMVFFDAKVHHKFLKWTAGIFKIPDEKLPENGSYRFPNEVIKSAIQGLLIVFFVLQILFPLRYLLYPGNVFWNEEGYRFSWRVMLMEKYGSAQFYVVDSESGKKIIVDNNAFLTPMQQKQMATQPDFILQYAHFLEKYYSEQGIKDPEIYVDNFVSLNGRRSQYLVDPTINLAEIEESLSPKDWILSD